VSQGASKVAVIAAVRKFLGGAQRSAAAGRDIVCEGRDQGTDVFPDASCKFFLVAEPQIRAERRANQLAKKGQIVSVAEVLADQAERDRRDAERDLAPMKPAPDAVIIDTTHLSTEQVVEQIENIVRARPDCPSTDESADRKKDVHV
jgi:cytidylate kinase